MRKFFTLLAGLYFLAAPIAAQAQAAGPALAEARARVACGAGTLVSATYIGNGLLRVTCSNPNKELDQATQSALTGTALSMPVAAGLAIGLGVIAIAGGSSNDQGVVGSTSVTTTTNTTSYYSR